MCEFCGELAFYEIYCAALNSGERLIFIYLFTHYPLFFMCQSELLNVGNVHTMSFYSWNEL